MTLSPDEAARVATRNEKMLEDLVKRYDPEGFTVEVANAIITAQHRGKPLYPIFWMLQSIEACCAYARGHRTASPRKRHVYAISNLFSECTSPYEEFVLSEGKSIEMFMAVMSRRQLEVQADPHDLRFTFGRVHLLLGDGDRMSKTSAVLQDLHGLSIDQWVAYCAGAFHTASANHGKFSLETYLEQLPNVFSESSCASFVKLSSRSPSQIRDDYRSDRSGLRSPHLDVCLRSRFIESPIINFGEDKLLAPQPSLLIRHMISGIERAIGEDHREVWVAELGRSFEEYIFDLARTTFGDNIRRPDREDAREGEKRCDIAVELEDCVVLIECKATRFSLNLILEDNLRRDNSSERIREACDQLSQTKHSLFDSKAEKIVIPFIIVMDEIFGVNSDWYWSTAIQSDVKFNNSFLCRPQVLPLAAFELLMLVLRETEMSLIELVKEQVNAMNDPRNGDWLRAVPVLLPPETTGRLEEHVGAWEAFMYRLRSQA